MSELTPEQIAATEAAATAKAEQKAAEAAAAAAKLAKEAAAAEKAAAKEAEKAAKAQAKLDAIAAKAEAKAAAQAAKEANRMPENNGVRRPKPDTLCGRVWTLADTLSAQLNQAVPIAMLLEHSAAQGLVEGNVKTEYARWRKFNGITGRVTLPTPAVPAEATPTA